MSSYQHIIGKTFCVTLSNHYEKNLPTRYFEVIVVDDGGSDNSETIVSEYKTVLNIQYFWQESDGFRAGKARNIGAMIADGDYI